MEVNGENVVAVGSASQNTYSPTAIISSGVREGQDLTKNSGEVTHDEGNGAVDGKSGDSAEGRYIPLHPFKDPRESDEFTELIQLDMYEEDVSSEDKNDITASNVNPLSYSGPSITTYSFTGSEEITSKMTLQEEEANVTGGSLEIVARMEVIELVVHSDDDLQDADMYERPKLAKKILTLQLPNVANSEVVDTGGSSNAPYSVSETCKNNDVRKGTDPPSFTPLQEWEYVNGFPVDGVEDVEKWAAEVGLSRVEREVGNNRKKLKSSINDLPTKYGSNFETDEDASMTVEDDSTDGGENPTDNEQREHGVQKGKEKVDETI